MLTPCLGLVGTYICSPFYLGHHLPLGLPSDRETGEAALCTQDPSSLGSLLSVLSQPHAEAKRLRPLPRGEGTTMVIIVACVSWALPGRQGLCAQGFTCIISLASHRNPLSSGAVGLILPMRKQNLREVT